MNEEAEKFIEKNLFSNKKIILPVLNYLIYETEKVINIHELFGEFEDEQKKIFYNKLKCLILTSKKIIRIYIDYINVNYELFYLREVIGSKVNKTYYYKDTDNSPNLIKKVEILLKNQESIEVEIDKEMQEAKTVREQRLNAFNFIAELNKLII